MAVRINEHEDLYHICGAGFYIAPMFSSYGLSGFYIVTALMGRHYLPFSLSVFLILIGLKDRYKHYR